MAVTHTKEYSESSGPHSIQRFLEPNAAALTISREIPAILNSALTGVTKPPRKTTTVQIIRTGIIEATRHTSRARRRPACKADQLNSAVMKSRSCKMFILAVRHSASKFPETLYH